MDNKIEKQKIGIDIDDVIAYFMKHFIDYSNKKNGTSFKVDEISNYNLWETEIHPSKEHSVGEVLEFQNSTHFDNIGLVEGVKEAIEKLSKIYDIHFVTSRPQQIKEKTDKFLNKHFPENNFNVIYSGEIHGGKSKSDICSDFEIPLMIEDNPFYALDCASKGVRVFLIDKPWNKNHEPHDNIIKVNDWNEILNHLESK
jgi:uncharacterized HAD superfamily protein